LAKILLRRLLIAKVEDMRESNMLYLDKLNFIPPIISLPFIPVIAPSLFIGDGGWDDSVTTRAFSRTLALHGKIALNVASEHSTQCC
jgi:hypothetical protein